MVINILVPLNTVIINTRILDSKVELKINEKNYRMFGCFDFAVIQFSRFCDHFHSAKIHSSVLTDIVCIRILVSLITKKEKRKKKTSANKLAHFFFKFCDTREKTLWIYSVCKFTLWWCHISFDIFKKYIYHKSKPYTLCS